MRLKRFSIWLTVLVLSIGFIAHAESSDLFAKANATYQAKNFEEAAKLYEELLPQQKSSADLYYNLGNCYFKMNLLGKSILNYERALSLSPDDEDVQHNLALARSKTIDRVQPVPQLGIVKTWKNMLGYFSASGWGWLAVASVWMSLILGAIYLFLFPKAGIRSLGIGAMILSLLFVSPAFTKQKSLDHSREAVIVAPSANGKSAPDENANDIFVIHEGLKVQVLDKVGDFYKIKLADGKVGWLKSSVFEQI